MEQQTNLALLHLLHQCTHRLSASEKFRGQGRILNLLREHGTLTQRELIELTGRRSATLSEQLEKMERSGYLIREKNQLDRRNVDITLTPLGEQAALRAHQERQRRAAVFDALTDAEKSALSHTLNKLLTACEQLPQDDEEG